MKIENYEKTKAIILVTLAVVTVLAIGAGSLIHRVGKTHSKKGLGPVEEGTIEINESFDSISVDLSVAKLDVQYGDTASLYYKVPQNLIPKYNIKGNVLEIDNQSGNIDVTGDMRDLSNADYQVTLVIPRNSDYIKVSYSVDCGNVSLENVKAKEVSVDADFGKISIDEIECEECEISADMGDINLNNVNAKSFSVDADCGNIVVDGIETDSIVANNSMGNIEVKKSKAKSGEFNLDMGSLTINGDYDEITADCSMGSIEITTDRPESQIKLDLDVDMGSARVNGKEWKK